jgi:hypothetical protein
VIPTPGPNRTPEHLLLRLTRTPEHAPAPAWMAWARLLWRVSRRTDLPARAASAPCTCAPSSCRQPPSMSSPAWTPRSRAPPAGQDALPTSAAGTAA